MTNETFGRSSRSFVNIEERLQLSSRIGLSQLFDTLFIFSDIVSPRTVLRLPCDSSTNFSQIPSLVKVSIPHPPSPCFLQFTYSFVGPQSLVVFEEGEDPYFLVLLCRHSSWSVLDRYPILDTKKVSYCR